MFVFNYFFVLVVMPEGWKPETVKNMCEHETQNDQNKLSQISWKTKFEYQTSNHWKQTQK